LGSGTERNSGGAILGEAWATDVRMVTPGKRFDVLDQAHCCEPPEALRNVTLSAPLKSSLNCGENRDEAFELEMFRLCHFFAAGPEGPSRLHLAVPVGLNRCQFCPPVQYPVA
jgi:hypothetical protein